MLLLSTYSIPGFLKTPELMDDWNLELLRSLKIRLLRGHLRVVDLFKAHCTSPAILQTLGFLFESLCLSYVGLIKQVT